MLARRAKKSQLAPKIGHEDGYEPQAPREYDNAQPKRANMGGHANQPYGGGYDPTGVTALPPFLANPTDLYQRPSTPQQQAGGYGKDPSGDYSNNNPAGKHAQFEETQHSNELPKYGRRARTSEDASRQERQNAYQQEIQRQVEEVRARKEAERLARKEEDFKLEQKLERERQQRAAREREDMEREQDDQKNKEEMAMGGRRGGAGAAGRSRVRDKNASSGLVQETVATRRLPGHGDKIQQNVEAERQKQEVYLAELEKQRQEVADRKRKEAEKLADEERKFNARVEAWASSDQPLGAQYAAQQQQQQQSQPRNQQQGNQKSQEWTPPRGGGSEPPDALEQFQHQYNPNPPNPYGYAPPPPQPNVAQITEVQALRDEIVGLLQQQRAQIDDLMYRPQVAPHAAIHTQGIPIPTRVSNPPPAHRAYAAQMAAQPPPGGGFMHHTRRQMQAMEDANALLNRFLQEDETRRDEPLFYGNQPIVAVSPSHGNHELDHHTEQRAVHDNRGLALAAFGNEREDYLGSNIELSVDPPVWIGGPASRGASRGKKKVDIADV